MKAHIHAYYITKKEYRWIVLLLILLGTTGLKGIGQKESRPYYSITTVFRQGDEGYHTFRIPAVVKTNDGTLLAFAEGRKYSWADHEKNDIVMRRSFDNGKSWSEMTIVQNEGDTAFIWIGNPAPVVDRSTGTIHLLFCRKNETVFHTFSIDNGNTWSERKELAISKQGWAQNEWTWIGTGPGIGIQLERGKQNGRLVIPVHYRYEKQGKSYGGNRVIYSDDNGHTWLNGFRSETIESIYRPNENTCVELIDTKDDNSKIYFLPRRGQDKEDITPFRRLEALSGDGGSGLAIPYRPNKEIKTVDVQGALLRWSATDRGDERNRILFSATSRLVAGKLPKSEGRRHVAVWSSFDETQSWSAYPKRIWSGYSAYSSMVKTAEGNLGILFEAGTDYMFNTKVANRYSEIKFAIVNEAWLDMQPTGAKWDFRNISESAFQQGQILDSYSGGTHRILRSFGNVFVRGSEADGTEKYLHFDGRGKLVLPDDQTGSQFDFSPLHSFSLELLVRTAAGSQNSGCLISKVSNMNDETPGWRMDIDDKGLVSFMISDDDRLLVARSSISINDGKWHEVLGVRDANQKKIKLYVDKKIAVEINDETVATLANRNDLIVGASQNLAIDNFIGDIAYISITPNVSKH